MIRVKATILVKGKSKNVKVYLDETTYALLKQAGDKELFLQYVTDVYLTGLKDRAETRRHKSLDYLIDKGLEFEDKQQDLSAPLEDMEERAELKAAMETLTKRQRFIVIHRAVKGFSFREIGDLLGIHKESVRIEYGNAIKKLQKIFQNHSVKP